MITSTISHAKNHLSALLARVQEGETVLILDRDTPVARLVPVAVSATDTDDWLRRLERDGIVRRPANGDGPLTLPRPVAPKGGGDVLAALLADRADSP